MNNSGLKLLCNLNIIYGNLKSENSQRLCPETSTKLYVHEFGFSMSHEGGRVPVKGQAGGGAEADLITV